MITQLTKVDHKQAVSANFERIMALADTLRKGGDIIEALRSISEKSFTLWKWVHQEILPSIKRNGKYDLKLIVESDYEADCIQQLVQDVRSYPQEQEAASDSILYVWLSVEDGEELPENMEDMPDDMDDLFPTIRIEVQEIPPSEFTNLDEEPSKIITEGDYEIEIAYRDGKEEWFAVDKDTTFDLESGIYSEEEWGDINTNRYTITTIETYAEPVEEYQGIRFSALGNQTIKEAADNLGIDLTPEDEELIELICGCGSGRLLWDVQQKYSTGWVGEVIPTIRQLNPHLADMYEKWLRYNASDRPWETPIEPVVKDITTEEPKEEKPVADVPPQEPTQKGTKKKQKPLEKVDKPTGKVALVVAELNRLATEGQLENTNNKTIATTCGVSISWVQKVRVAYGFLPFGKPREPKKPATPKLKELRHQLLSVCNLPDDASLRELRERLEQAFQSEEYHLMDFRKKETYIHILAD